VKFSYLLIDTVFYSSFVLKFELSFGEKLKRSNLWTHIEWNWEQRRWEPNPTELKISVFANNSSQTKTLNLVETEQNRIPANIDDVVVILW